VLAAPLGVPTTGAGDRNWVACAGGTAVWIFVASPEPRLVDLLTRAVTPLPPFPDDGETRAAMENARGVVYGDGTVFLYTFLFEKSTSKFMAAILRPVDAAWSVMKRVLEVPTDRRSDSGAVYHDGKVLVCVGEYFWSVFTQGDLGVFAGLQSRWSESEDKKYARQYNYVLESQGELLWASVLLERDFLRGHAPADISLALSVTVHALVKGAAGVLRWAVRDGWSLGDRVLFLGSPASFAVDAHQLGVVGGCAYFVFRRRVFRYGLVDGHTQLIKQLPRDWSMNGAHMWVWPQPTIAPIEEIREWVNLHPSKKPKLSN
jgi:hypothetical protein